MTPEDIYHVTVSVTSQYVAAQSIPDQNNYVFIYHFIIQNAGSIGAKLINRHWEIMDSHGNIQKMNGAGVIGQQPYLKPGEIFEYTSGTSITTPIGSMQGSYDMVADDGIEFKAVIPLFRLSSGLVVLH